MRLVCTSVLALATLLASVAAHATPPRTASLSWARLAGAESCIGSLPLALGVERRLGRSLFVAPEQAQLAVEGMVSPLPEGSGWRALVRVVDPAGRVLGERELQTPAPTCAFLDEPLLIVVGLLLDPDTMATAPPVDTRGAAPVSAPPAPLVTPAPGVPAAPGQTAFWSVGAGFALAGGLLPEISPGVTLRAERWQPGWGLTLSGTLHHTSEATSQNQHGTLRLQRIDLGLCPVGGRHGPVHLALCAGPGVGLWSSAGSDLVVNRDGQRATLLLAAGGQARVHLVGALDLWLSGQLETSLPRLRFSFEQTDGSRPVLFHTPPLAVSGALGLAGSWGS